MTPCIETPVKGGTIIGFFEQPKKEPTPVEAEAPAKAVEQPKKTPAKKTAKK